MSRRYTRRSMLATTAALPVLAIGGSLLTGSTNASGAPVQKAPGTPGVGHAGPTTALALRPRLYLEQKLRETITECAVPALAAVMVRSSGDTIVSAQEGLRKLGAPGAGNAIEPTDRFALGSVSKVLTGNLIGKLIKDGVGGLGWTSKIVDVYASIWDNPAARDGYKNVTIEQLIAHTSGMPYEPNPANDNVDDWEQYTDADMTKDKLRARRRRYIKNAVLDAPLHAPNAGFVYGGGPIIVSSMFEHKTGETYEDLLKKHIFEPLGMNDSGTGVTVRGGIGGPCQHRWDPEARTTTADTRNQKKAYNWHCRAPVGGVSMSAADMGKFIREQLRDDPKLFSKTTRKMLQTHRVSASSETVRGGWGSSAPGSDQAEIWHTGDIGVAVAGLSVRLANKMGGAAMCNASGAFGNPAVGDMLEVTYAMDRHWDKLFAADGAAPVECVHPMPALARANNWLWLFTRTHDGKVHRALSKDSGQSFEQRGDFGAVTMNSGLAAGASLDRKHVFMVGRGLDKRMWFCFSNDKGETWQGSSPILAGVFRSGPAITVDSTGKKLRVFGIGNDRKMWRALSSDGGKTWVGWSPIGEGVFTSAPAAAASADGQVIHVFARGNDMRCWRNVSKDGGKTFEPHWEPIGQGIFASSLAACASSNGEKVQVMGRGCDRAMWRNTTLDQGDNWAAQWSAVPGGVFSSAPSLVCTDNFSVVRAVAFGTDFRVYRNRLDLGSWDGWQQTGSRVHL